MSQPLPKKAIDEFLMDERSHIERVEGNLKNNINLVKALFDVPEGTTELTIRVDGFSPRSDGIETWSLCQQYRVRLIP